MIHTTATELVGPAAADGRALHLVPDEAAVAPERVRLRHAEGELRNLRRAMARVENELAATRIREIEARNLALHDALTGLPNQRYFCQRLEMALASGESPPRVVAVLFIDLNGFKGINDAHGHATGDRLLQIIADRLNHSMRAEDMVCRLGGDEFACLLSGISDRRRLSRVATKICTVLAAPVSIGKIRLAATASIGIALSPADGTTAKSLVDHADSAMYRAKHCETRYTFFRAETAAPGLAPMTGSV
jgi:diguanylate cyclase (GGDEF)-like protein